MRIRLLAVCVLAWTVAACGRDAGNPVTPGSTNGGAAPGPGSGSGSAACRNYASATTRVSSSSSFVQTASRSCAFDTTSLQLVCDSNYTDSLGTAGTERTVASYRSVADFVGEVRVIPPLVLRFQEVTTSTASGVTATNTAVFTYDSQSRVVERRDSSNVTFVIAFTQWDAAGRPTFGMGVGSGDTLAIVYDDPARSVTTTATSPSSGVQGVTTLVYDANGNELSSHTVTTTPVGPVILDVTHSTTATQQVCN